MDLFDNMHIFVRVVERGSFSAVARELNMGQPAVSKQVRALEQYLGGPLFARSHPAPGPDRPGPTLLQPLPRNSRPPRNRHA